METVAGRRVKADLHAHMGSGNEDAVKRINRHGVEGIVRHAREKLGPGGILGLVNFDDDRYEHFASLARRQDGIIDFGNSIFFHYYDLLVVKGEEVPTKDGNGVEVHLLFLGTKEGKHIKPFRPLEETVIDGLDRDGILVLDHPCYALGAIRALQDKGDELDWLLDAADAMVVHSGLSTVPAPGYMEMGAIFGKANKDAMAFYRTVRERFPHLGALNDGDTHSLKYMGSNFSWLEMPDAYFTLRKPEEIVAYLRQAVRDCRGEGRTKPLRKHALGHMCGVAYEHRDPGTSGLAGYLTGLKNSLRRYGEGEIEIPIS
jgi:hypothetical protein